MGDQSWRGKVGKLSLAEIDEYLALANIARVACLTDDGAPYVVPMWYQWDGEVFWVIPRERSEWAPLMKRDSRVSLTIDEGAPPYRKVLAQGTAMLVEEANVGGRWVGIAEQMSLRYLGENGPKYLVPTLNEPRWLFKIVPTRVRTWRGVEWARRYKTQLDGQ